MVFNSLESGAMTFSITDGGREYWRGRRFLTSEELAKALRKWWYNPICGITVVNIVRDKHGPRWKQAMWYSTKDVDKLVGDLMDISLTHGIIHIGNTPETDNVIGVAETPNGSTNVTGRFMELLVEKIGGGK